MKRQSRQVMLPLPEDIMELTKPISDDVLELKDPINVNKEPKKAIQ
jgi:hypothetical protein